LIPFETVSQGLVAFGDLRPGPRKTPLRGSTKIQSNLQGSSAEPWENGIFLTKPRRGALETNMSHTFSSLMVHGLFSTSQRRPVLRPEIMPELARIVGGIIRDRDGKLLAMNGTADHVHLLAALHPKHAVSDVFRDIKAISCGWIHDRVAQMKDFAWQGGYTAFSVSKSVAPKVESYIARQVEHHKSGTFVAELIALLEKHGIEYDKQFLLD
jgi:REP element-mobilizing transposase RayT